MERDGNWYIERDSDGHPIRMSWASDVTQMETALADADRAGWDRAVEAAGKVLSDHQTGWNIVETNRELAKCGREIRVIPYQPPEQDKPNHKPDCDVVVRRDVCNCGATRGQEKETETDQPRGRSTRRAGTQGQTEDSAEPGRSDD